MSWRVICFLLYHPLFWSILISEQEWIDLHQPECEVFTHNLCFVTSKLDKVPLLGLVLWKNATAYICFVLFFSFFKQIAFYGSKKEWIFFLAGLSINDSIPSLMQFTDNSQQQVQSTLPSNLTARFLIRSLNTCFHNLIHGGNFMS